MSDKTIAGKTIQVDAEGFLVNPEDWNEEMAPELAKEFEINELTDAHWKVINFMRNDFKEKGQIPSIRRMKNAGGIPTKDLYDMFPDGPAKKLQKYPA